MAQLVGDCTSDREGKLTDEQKALAEKERLRQQREAHYEKFINQASHRQLRAELRRIAKTGTGSKGFKMNGAEFSDSKTPNTAGLDNAFAVILGTILDNTKTVPWKGIRKDQEGPGKMGTFVI